MAERECCTYFKKTAGPSFFGGEKWGICASPFNPPIVVYESCSPDRHNSCVLGDLSEVLYFPSHKDLPVITDHQELKKGERLRVLISKDIVTARIQALAERITAEVSPNPDDFVFGAILEGGRYLLEKVRALLPSSLNRRIPIEHLDIKSRSATDTGTYQIRSLPRPEIVNRKIYRVFEGVADSGRTLEMAQTALSQPPFSLRKLCVALLIDKRYAHPGIPLPDCVDYCLLAMGRKWMVGCGLDTDGRFRDLPYIALYEKLAEVTF